MTEEAYSDDEMKIIEDIVDEIVSGATTQNIIEYEEEEEEEEEEIFQVVESDPQFPGGAEAMYRYVSQNMRYPQLARENGISGRVYVTFVVEKDGSLSGVRVLRDIGGGCGHEAVRIVKSMPRWIPGKQRGKNVRVQYNLPVNFSLR